MQSVAIGLMFLFAATLANAKSYYVEPMICKGQWNKQPPAYTSGYERGGIKVTSFWSVRKDCSLAPSSATGAEFASITDELKFDESKALGTWIAGPLQIKGKLVSAPMGAWGNPVKLKVVGSKSVNGVRTDLLEGRDIIFKDYYYDLTCEAVVVSSPSHVENNTGKCQ